MPSQAELRIVEYVILFGSIILHEVSHGWAALALGDDTAKRAGRLSLNPLAHIDPLGTIVLPAILILTHSGFIFGWAKPVPVDISKLRNPRNGAVVTGLAGPAMNLVLVGAAWAFLRGALPVAFWAWWIPYTLGLLNLWLAMFNLLPIPPLDGSSVVERFIPRSWFPAYLSIRPYTLVLVMALVILGARLGAQQAVFNSIESWWIQVTNLTRLLGVP